MAGVLAVVVGTSLVGGSTSSSDRRPEPSVLNVAYVPRPSPWAVPRPTVDPATFEGSSALSEDEFVIPPPRWLAGRRPAALTPRVTARVGGLGWRTDPYAK